MSRTADEILDRLKDGESGRVLGRSRIFNFEPLREASLAITKHEDSGGAFYSITISRLPPEIAADIAALFENCRSEP